MSIGRVLDRLLDRLDRWLKDDRVTMIVGPAEDASWDLEPDKGDFRVATINKMQEGQRMPLRLQIRNRRERDAAIDGVPAWDLVEGNDRGITLTPAGDGRTAFLHAPVGSAGTARVIVTADADLGEGVEEITSEADFIISALQATSVDIMAGEPEDVDDAGTGGTPGGTAGGTTGGTTGGATP
jgi:hypothetical protein